MSTIWGQEIEAVGAERVPRKGVRWGERTPGFGIIRVDIQRRQAVGEGAGCDIPIRNRDVFSPEEWDVTRA